MSLKSISACILLSLFTLTSIAQENMPTVGYQLVNPEKVAAKNFYFTLLINNSNHLKDVFSKDDTLKQIAKNKYLQLTKSEDTPKSIGTSLKFSKREIETIGSRLSEIYKTEEVFQDLYNNHIIPSGCYYMLVNQKANATQNIKKIWEQDAEAINRLIDVYGIGVKPYYPWIDSLSYPVNSKKHNSLMKESKSLILFEAENNMLFYHIPYYSAELLLDINDRNESIVYEPLWEKENKAAYERIKNINWDNYQYSVLVALGFGPDNYDFPLNPGAKIRLRTAVTKYKEGIAPFILVTGGKVYPYKTRNVEAFHMKQYLMNHFDVPEDHIIIEPHARHTTSNIRNAARIIFRNGIPMDKPMLVSSSEAHIDRVSSGAFAERCQKELGLIPYRPGKKLGINFIELYPTIDALQINPIEPLDP